MLFDSPLFPLPSSPLPTMVAPPPPASPSTTRTASRRNPEDPTFQHDFKEKMRMWMDAIPLYHNPSQFLNLYLASIVDLHLTDAEKELLRLLAPMLYQDCLEDQEDEAEEDEMNWLGPEHQNGPDMYEKYIESNREAAVLFDKKRALIKQGRHPDNA